MSKIFEALRKTEGQLADMARAVLADEASLTRTASPHIQSESLKISEHDVPTSQSEVRSQAIELGVDSPMLPFDGSDEDAAEQYRIIRTKIHHHPSQPRIILVSSPMSGDGKTISAGNLAASLSLQENLRVLLLDCDFRRSVASRMLGLSITPGLGEALRNEAALESLIVRIEQFPNLYVLPPGEGSSAAAELLMTGRWQSLLQIFRSEFRFVVIDAPPIGAVAEYELLQLASDGVILVVRQDHTNRQLWRRALETVPPAKRLGVILNCAKPWFLWKTNSYYYAGAGR